MVEAKAPMLEKIEGESMKIKAKIQENEELVALCIEKHEEVNDDLLAGAFNTV